MEIVVILHNIRSVYNVGSVFRTCDAVGVSKIYLVGVTPTPLDRFGKFRADFSKVALGAEKTVQWEYFKSFKAVYKKLKSASGRAPAGGGYEILAVEQDKRSVPYYSIVRSHDTIVRRKIALVFGGETKGLPKSILDKADRILEIPMRGAMIRQAHHPKNKKTLLNGKALRQAQGKESLNVSVAAGIVIYDLLYRCQSIDLRCR